MADLRRHDLDNLRSFLASLVVVHHTATTYGAPSVWYYQSPLVPSGSVPALRVLYMVDQSFFMGLFFWISGRMSARSLKKAGPVRFVKSKLLRLGVPAAVYSLLIHPLPVWMNYTGADPKLLGLVILICAQRMRGVQGPVWYPALLLMFDVAAAGVAHLTSSAAKVSKDLSEKVPAKEPESGKPPVLASRYRLLARWGWIGVGAVGFLVRLVSPYQDWSKYVIAVQTALIPKYAFAYGLGFLAYYADESRLVGPFDPAERPAAIQLEVSDQQAGAKGPKAETSQKKPSDTKTVAKNLSAKSKSSTRPGAYLALALVGSVGPLVAQLAMDPKMEQMSGGWNSLAAVNSLWTEFSFVTLGSALMACSEAWFNKPTSSWIWNPRYSYAAFLFHPPVIVALNMVTDKVITTSLGVDRVVSSPVWKAAGPIAMTIVNGAIGTVGSFVLGRWIVERVPWVKDVI